MSSIGNPYQAGGDRLTHPTDRIITYSPAFTLVPTYECFNRCTYCNFRVNPGQDEWLSLDAARFKLKTLRKLGIYEILILSGEVQGRSPRRSALIKHIYELCELALEFGFIPHSNVGPLSFEEMDYLRKVNGSMGLMVEQLANLPVHYAAPSKKPELRLQQLAWAGQLKIPFTTGLLLGIGETEQHWVESLQAIALTHKKWGHIQEVILQPHSPGQQQTFEGLGFDPQRLPEVIRLAREILPEAIALQIPPNLVAAPEWVLRCLEAGARDLGGIVPKDEVNPDYEHLELTQLSDLLRNNGWHLQPRLAIYPQYDVWLGDRLKTVVMQCRQTLRR